MFGMKMAQGAYDNNTATSDHSIDITTYRDCKGQYGEFLYAYVGETPPNDVSGSGGNLINLGDYAEGDPSADPAVPQGLYNDDVPAPGGRLWFKVFDKEGDGGDGDYTPYGYSSIADSINSVVVDYNTGALDTSAYDHSSVLGSNAGEYIIDVVTETEPADGFSSFLNDIIDPVKEFLMGDRSSVPPTDGITRKMYKGITDNVNYVAAVQAAMVLSIIFFAFTYMVGLSRITQKEFIILAIKMGFVITLISPTSWEFFYNYLFTAFVEGVEDLMWIVSSQFQDIVAGATAIDADGKEVVLSQGLDDVARNNFAFLDQTLARFFTAETNIKILGLMSSFPIGIIMAILIYVAMAFFIFVVIRCVLMYLTSIVMVALLLFIAPIIIPFILFNSTKSIFDRWLSQLLSFGFQPVLLFSILAIFNAFVFSAFYTLLGYSVCWSCIFEVDLPISEIFGNSPFFGGNFDKICVISSYEPWGVSSESDVSSKIIKTPVGLFMILIFFILINAMHKFVDWIVYISGSMTAGIHAVLTSSGADGMIGSAKDAVTFGAQKAVSGSVDALDKADFLTGRVASDKVKTTARKALPRAMTRGGKDGMGGKNIYSDKFMTSTEKRALRREKKMFATLDKKEQAGYKLMKKEQAKAYKDADKYTRKEMRDEKRKEAKFTGKAFHSKSAKEYNKARMDKDKLASYADLKKDEKKQKAAHRSLVNKATNLSKKGKDVSATKDKLNSLDQKMLVNRGKREGIKESIDDKTKKIQNSSSTERKKARREDKIEAKKRRDPKNYDSNGKYKK